MREVALSKPMQPGQSGKLSWNSSPLTTDHLHDILPQWRDLWQSAVERNLFVSPDFVVPSLPLLDEMQPSLVTVYDGSKLIGLMLMRRDFGYAKLPLFFLRTAIHPEQYLGTPLVRAGCEDGFAQALCGWVDGSFAFNIFVKLAHMSADTSLMAALIDRSRADHRVVFELGRHSRAAIRPANPKSASPASSSPTSALREDKGPSSGPGAATGSAIRAGAAPSTHSGAHTSHPPGIPHDDSDLSSGRRKSIRKAWRGLAALGEARFERLTDQGAVNAWIEDFFRMENTGWKAQGGSSILSSPKETQLYRALIVSAFNEGTLQFARLCIDDTPIAYTLDVLAPPQAFCLKSAIDPAYRKYSPGVLMERETLRFYRAQSECQIIDSCTASDNALLNELWPDQKPIVDLIIGRKGFGYHLACKLVRAIKMAQAQWKSQ